MLSISRKKSGFTLIELLVVIAIIAILAAILFPVFARAREAAKKSTCQSNLKEISTAFIMYKDDYDGVMLSSWRSASPGVAPVQGDPVAFTSTTAGWPALLKVHMKSTDIMWCPSDSADPATSTTVSYWMKAAIDMIWGTCRKESDYEFPDTQVIFYEHAGWHWGDAAKKLSDGVNLNFAFFDGHVATRRLQKATANNDSPVGAGEPAYYNLDNNTPTPTLVGPGNFCNPTQYSDKLN